MMVVKKNRVKINSNNIYNIVIQNNEIFDSSDSEIITPNSNKITYGTENIDDECNSFFTKKRKSIHSSFLFLKKELKIEKFKRKTQIDSLLKKCKSKAFLTIHEALKNCLKIKLTRLPQQFITNIKIEFNKCYLDKTIYEIYNEYEIIPSIDEFIEKDYILEEKKTIFQNFLSLTFKNVFESYISSKQYIKDYHHIVNREGEPFAILFNFISKIFIQYYTKSKGNRNKVKKEIKDINFDNVDKKCTIFEIRKQSKI